MSWTHLECLLVSEGEGAPIPVGARAVLIGRAVDSDVPLAARTASRRHALICMDIEGPLLVPLGRLACLINGEEVPTAVRSAGEEPVEGGLRGRLLRDGDALEFPGCRLRVQIRTRAQPSTCGWAIWRGSQDFVELPVGPATVGGGASDGVWVAGWPAAAVRIWPVDGGLFAEAAAAITRNGEPLPASAVDLTHGDRLGTAGTFIKVLNVAAGEGSTHRPAAAKMPREVVLHPLPPAGGLIEVVTSLDTMSTFVSGNRYDLLQTLLKPPGGYKPGEMLPDAQIISAVWGGSPPEGADAVNTLTKRLRKDLARGGINGAALVKRSRGQTRFRLAKNTRVRVLAPR